MPTDVDKTSGENVPDAACSTAQAAPMSCSVGAGGVASSDAKTWVSPYRDGLNRSLILTLTGVPLVSVLAYTTKNVWIATSGTYALLLVLAALSGKRT